MQKFSLLLLVTFWVMSSRLVVSAQDTSAVNAYTADTGIRIGFRATGLANITNWQTTEYIDSRYRMYPYLSGSFSVFLQERITSRLTLEAGATYIQLGLASSTADNYRPGQRFNARSTDRSAYTMLAFPVYILYDLNKRNVNRKYVLLGVNVYFNDPDTYSQFAQSISVTKDPDTGDTFTTSALQRPVNRFSPALVAGVGWEKRFSKKSAVNLRAVTCVGLTSLIQTFLTVTVSNPARYYAPYSSTNELLNRGTYAGLELCYLFSFR